MNVGKFNDESSIGGQRPGRLCGGDPRRAVRAKDGARGARRTGRRLPQLGLHPDQGAAQKRAGLRLLQNGRSITDWTLAGRGAAPTSKPSWPVRAAWPRPCRKGVRFLLDKNKIDLIPGFGRLTAPGRIDVDGAEYEADHIVLATGAQAARNGLHAHRRRACDLVAAGADAHATARINDRRRIGCHRQRVRVVLRRAGRAGHRRRVHAPHDAARRRGGVEDHGARIPQTARDGADFDDGESQ